MDECGWENVEEEYSVWGEGYKGEDREDKA